MQGQKPAGHKDTDDNSWHARRRMQATFGKNDKKRPGKILGAARKVQGDNPEIFRPIADFFDVDIAERLNNPSTWEGLAYEEY